MKFKRGRTSRAVAYLMSAVMISQTLLSPVSTVYASAVDYAASQQVAAETEKGNVGSSDDSSNGQDTGTDDTTVTDDTGSSDVSPSTNDVAAQSDDATAVEHQTAGSRSVQSAVVASSNGYNPAAPARPVDSNVTVGFYKKKDSITRSAIL